ATSGIQNSGAGPPNLRPRTSSGLGTVGFNRIHCNGFIDCRSSLVTVGIRLQNRGHPGFLVCSELSMRAAVLLTPSKLEIRDVARPAAAPGEALIRPMRAGICGSDVSFYLGHRTVEYPWVLGHELVGRIVAVPETATHLRAGQRVVVEPNYPCGACRF